MTLDEFLTLPLSERIVALHDERGPHGNMSHDTFAKMLGTSRQTIIGWEHGVEPKRYADKLAAFSGFPRAAFLRREGEALAVETSLGLLRELAAKVDRIALDLEELVLLVKGRPARAANQTRENGG